ncbi:hypothetical protein FRC0191_00517 [Corynebacterium diphtheriae]|nr:hypothetical protein FRC0191_00517 [Corynebacterium diphtheriae]
MHGITIDSGRALDMLASMIEEAEQQYQAHIRETPHYEPASAGEGFVGSSGFGVRSGVKKTTVGSAGHHNI